MFSDQDRALIFKLIEELTGASHTTESRQGSLLTNVERRMQELGVNSLVNYLKLVESDNVELGHLVSALTIHTTSWFRENPHFVAFQEILLEALKKNEVFKVWCAACSSGEEVYSFALLLEEFRRVHPQFNYHILGTDIDPISVSLAERAIYPKKQMGFHVIRYKAHVLEGSGRTADFFTLSKAIRDRCTFRVHDLRSSSVATEGPFHVIICRNVLIYFSPEMGGKIISNLLNNIGAQGYLMLGHSEAINGVEFGLTQRGHSVYCKGAPVEGARSMDRFRIICIDESKSARRFLERTFTDLGFDVIAVATGSEATAYINSHDVDLITIDAKGPGSWAEKWLKAERSEGLKAPVVLLTDTPSADSGGVIDMLSLGAQDFIDKEKLKDQPRKFKDVLLELIRNHGQKRTPVVKSGGSSPVVPPSVVMIGASTGGPQALVRLLTQLPKGCPPIMVTQHMSPKFARTLSERLAEISGLKLAPMRDGLPLQDGHLYMALGDHHIGIGDERGQMVLRTSNAPPFNGHRPSVDYMFNSALGMRHSVFAALLTGMGRDGALGLRFLRKEGAYCVAQSEEDCVVYGMPKEAIEREATDFVGNMEQIRQVMLEAFDLRKKKDAA